MDHHDDWGHWPEDDPSFGDHDTADLGDGLGDGLGHDPDPGHLPGFEDHDDPLALGHEDTGPPPDVSPPPLDLFHDGDPGHVDDPGHDPGHDPGDDPGSDPDLSHDDPGHQDPGHDVEEPPGYPDDGGHTVGTDPDWPGDHDPTAGADFPPPLDLDARPEPSDGYPWSDADALGDPGTVEDPGHPTADGAGPDDLLAYAGLEHPPAGADPWSLLLAADDPATSALARWWGPDAA